MTKYKAEILSILSSRGASWLTPIVSTCIAYGVVRLSELAPFLRDELSGIDQVSITAFIVAVAMSGINAYTNRNLRAGTAQVQGLLNDVLPLKDQIEEDGIAGPITKQAATIVTKDLK